MKTIFVILALFFVSVFTFTFVTFVAIADELTPLDLNNGYENFEVRVGLDKYAGKYFTYHYEFE